MSRTPQVSDEDYPAMPDRAKTMGYEAAGIKKCRNAGLKAGRQPDVQGGLR